MIPIQDDMSAAMKAISNNINQLQGAVCSAGGGWYVVAEYMDRPFSEFMEMLARNNIYLNAQYKEPKHNK